MKIEFMCDLVGVPVPLKHHWEYSVGSDHAPVALRADWQEQLIGMHPFVELSFMPTALASGRKTVFHYNANVTPPKDLNKASLNAPVRTGLTT